MRILIDLQGSQTVSRLRGIGRYSLSLVREMVKLADKHELWLLLNAAFPESVDELRAVFKELIPHQRIKVFTVPLPVKEIAPENAWRARVAEKMREQVIQDIKPDVLLVTSLFEGFLDDAVTSVQAFAEGIPTAVIFYDLIPYLAPEIYLPQKTAQDYYYRKIASLKHADLLLAISDYAKQEAIKHLDLKPQSVVNISSGVDLHLGSEHGAYIDVQAMHQRLFIQRKFILYTPGNFEPRKNIEGLITAFARLPIALRQQYQLVVVVNLTASDHDQLMRLSKKVGLKKGELILTGFIADPDLVALYQSADLFVYPSIHEGFGLPIIEAMALGCPVIGSNLTSIPEVIGWDAALFDPHSPDSMAAKIENALTNPLFREELIAHGQAQYQQFTWQRTAKRALDAIEALFCAEPLLTSPVVKSTTGLIEAIVEEGKHQVWEEDDYLMVAESIAFNAVNTERQCLVDISELAQRDAKTGIQRVVRSILLEMLKTPPKDQQVRAIYYDGQVYRYADQFTAVFLGEPSSNDILDPVVDFTANDTYLALDLNVMPTVYNYDTLKRLHTLGVKLYFVVYDLLPIQHPEWWEGSVPDCYDKWLKDIVQLASGIICISNAVADELRAWLSAQTEVMKHPPQIGYFHLGADIASSHPTDGLPQNAATILAQFAVRKTFLMVGTLEPRKGHAQVLQAFERLWANKRSINLVIVGKPGWLVDALINKLNRHPELHQRLFVLESISDEFLEKVYEASTCLIAASEGEGFGLPLIEASAYGLPIIARALPVFREVAGSHAYYFDGQDDQALAEAIDAWLLLDANASAPQSHGMPRLTWAQSAQVLMGSLG